MKTMMQFQKIAARVAIASLLPAGLALAQAARPDAGTTLETLRDVPKPLPQGPEVTMPERWDGQALGGQSVRVREIRLRGNTALETTFLLSAIQADAAMAQPMDIDRLRALADRTTAAYRDAGFPFARAFLPAQALDGGVLEIQVLEGRYGAVQARSSDPALAEAAQRYLQILVPGDAIASAPLERATLLISDWPGVELIPVMRPGAQTGEGNLDVLIEQKQRTAASISIDNHGSRYTDPMRVQFNGAIHRAFGVGDQLSLTGIAPVEGLWVGNLHYALPLGARGWRAQLGFSRLQYGLREEFVGFYGRADVHSLTLSYPLVRSRAWNVGAALAYQHKELSDTSVLYTQTKKVDATPLTLTFDQRDALLAGGLGYGTLTTTSGAIDNGPGGTAYAKWTLDLARIQQLGSGWSAYGRWFQQFTSDNLDSSEKMMLGGAGGVRAYPSGEASGDQGQLFQAELRSSFGSWSPYLFYDYGKVQVDARPARVFFPVADKIRSGAGLGLRYQSGGFSWNVALAWASEGGKPEADGKTPGDPRAWLEARYAFD